jgi:hypothetical protein
MLLLLLLLRSLVLYLFCPMGCTKYNSNEILPKKGNKQAINQSINKQLQQACNEYLPLSESIHPILVVGMNPVSLLIGYTHDNTYDS